SPPTLGTVPCVVACRSFDFCICSSPAPADVPLHIRVHVHDRPIGFAAVFIFAGVELVPLGMDVCYVCQCSQFIFDVTMVEPDGRGEDTKCAKNIGIGQSAVQGNEPTHGTSCQTRMGFVGKCTVMGIDIRFQGLRKEGEVLR